MEPQKFIQNYKCDCFQPENYCNCPHKIIGSDTLIDSVNDVADAVIEVMNMCGIRLVKAKAFRDVIIYYLLHFEEIRHRIDSIPKKRLAKEGLINDLSRKCKMNRSQTQMAYSIIKRVFKAFYYGSDEGGVPNYLLSRKLTHSPECLWVHAAERTAQIYAAYEGLFFACQKDIECKIKLIYKKLYDRILSRTLGDDNNECICMKCMKRITAETLRPSKVTTQMHYQEDRYEVMFTKELDDITKMQAYIDENYGAEEPNSGFQKVESGCSCPTLKVLEKDYVYRTFADSVTSDCSQGPFICRWLSISKEEYEADDAKLDIKLSEEVVCPPCYLLDSECEPECRCSCEECKCQTDENYFCYDTDASFENDFGQDEMEDEQDYDEDIEDTSSKVITAIQRIGPPTILMSAKCNASEPKRHLSKCSTNVKNVSKDPENYDASFQKSAQQQLYNSLIPTTETLNQKKLQLDAIAGEEDNYKAADMISLIWS